MGARSHSNNFSGPQYLRPPPKEPPDTSQASSLHACNPLFFIKFLANTKNENLYIKPSLHPFRLANSRLAASFNWCVLQA